MIIGLTRPKYSVLPEAQPWLTDLKGRLTYLNEDFIDGAESSLEEVIGKAHNIVRQPGHAVEGV